MIYKEKNTYITTLIPYILILAGCLLMLFRTVYGLDFTDESYYIAVAKRFSMGDRPFLEEWYTTQLIGVLLQPLYVTYCRVNGSQDGVILFFRICYVIFSGSISVILFNKLRKTEKVYASTAICAALLYLFYVRGSIPTLSYYSIGLGTFLIFVLFYNKKQGSWNNFIAGISFAVSVLCMPYMAAYFIGIVVCDLISCMKNKEKFCFYFYSGIILSAVIFLCLWIDLTSLKEIADNLSYILQDPTHSEPWWSSVLSFIVFMKKTFYRELIWLLLGEFLAIVWWYVFKHKDAGIKKTLKVIAYFLFFIHVVYVRTFFEGGILIGFLVLAAQVALLNGQAELTLAKKYLFPGIMFGVIWVCGSNVGQRVFNMGCLIADIWAFQIIWEDIRHSRGVEKIIKYVSPILLVGVILLIRMFDIYRDSTVSLLNTCITDGSAKGIYTTAERSKDYMNLLSELNKYTTNEDKLVSSNLYPIVYLDSLAECGTYTVGPLHLEDKRAWEYYKRYPEKIPTVIFIMNPEYGKYQAWRYSSHMSGVSEEKVELSGWFAELVEKEGYQTYEEDCGIFYVKE